MKGPATGCKDPCQKKICASDCGDDAVCTSIGLFLTTTIVGLISSRIIELLAGIGYFRYVFCESGVDGEEEQCCPGFGKLCIPKKVQKIIAAVWFGIGTSVLLFFTYQSFNSDEYGWMALFSSIFVRSLSFSVHCLRMILAL